MRNASLLLVVLAATLAVGRVAAAPPEKDKPGSTTAAGKDVDPKKSEPVFPQIIDRKHHLGPGDVVEIVVENYPDLSRIVRLFTDGTFDYPSIGSVQSAGLTVGELRERMVEAFKKELRRPVVYVNVREIYVPPTPTMVIPKITALGAVSRKGEMELLEPRPLRVVLALLGPLENADLSKIRVRYPDGSARTADFTDFSLKGPEAVKEHDFEIKGGEEIILLEKPIPLKIDPIRFTVLGAVAKPGTFQVESAVSILEILDRAGGPQPGAELEKVEVSGPGHKNTHFVDVEKYVSGDTSANYMSQADDVIVVKSKPHRILLVGDVAKKGWMAIGENVTLLQVYLDSGAASGDYEKTQVIRRGKDGKAVYTTVNIRDIEKQKKPDFKILPDDVVFIPHKKVKKGIGYFLNSVLGPAWLMRSLAPVP